MQTKLLLLQTLSPLHAGTGQGVGVIDLPIAREKATGIPFLPGSSVKGVLRDAYSQTSSPTPAPEKLFGPDMVNAEAHASSVQFSDMRLLLLPVRSISGVFAWVTSPFLLQRFQRDLLHMRDFHAPSLLAPPAAKEGCRVANSGCEIVANGSVVLEDLSLQAEPSADVNTWAGWLGAHLFPDDEYWQAAVAARLCIVHDDVLTFLLQTATEITARIRMNEETKTVAQGALWYEESLPTETILTGIVMATPIKKAGTTVDDIFGAVSSLTNRVHQMGGNATVGRGLCQLRLV